MISAFIRIFYFGCLASGVFCSVVTGPSDATVVLDQTHELTCVVAAGDIPTWEELFPNGTTERLFTIGNRFSPDRKYLNFYISGTLPDYNLRVETAKIEDEGFYQCGTTGTDISGARLSVEGSPSKVTIDCSSSTNCPADEEDFSSELTCTCKTIGAYPESLHLEWTDATPNSEVTTTPSNTGRQGSFDFTQIAVANVTGNTGVVQCTLIGYVNNIAEDVRKASYDYSSPACSLTAVQDTTTCETADFTCNCENDKPKVSKWSLFSQSMTKIGNSVDGTFKDVDISAHKTSTFYCRGCNGIYGGLPASTTVICEPGTTTVLPTSDAKTGEDRNHEPAPALIAICCVEGVVIIAMMCLFVFLYTIKKGSRKEDSQSLAAHHHDATENTSTAHMDLQETNHLSSSHINVDIPFQNLNLRAPFPGKGLMKYQKAQMTSTSKREEIVVKTVSDVAPVRLAKLQADEVRKLATLASSVNIVQFLGRCNNIPNLLCYEFVNGTNLGQYLKENFQPSKIHQYRNTKQKRYHVPEKGSVEILPRIALQIAHGMKYLTAQKFLHPGLRSEKVIVDVSGQCKLYDFVSDDNAKDIMAILWGKSVPYQWMPPEYLFLERLGPFVDVWSFGVLMWEIFSYGALPHKGKGRGEVEKELRGKENLPLPNNCPGAIWQITLNCWDQSPEKRPSFDHMSLQLSHMCSDNKKYDEIQVK